MPTLNLRDSGNFLSRCSLLMHSLGKDPDSEGDRWIEDYNNPNVSATTHNANIDTWNGYFDAWGRTTDPLILTANSGGTWTPAIGDQPPRAHPRPK